MFLPKYDPSYDPLEHLERLGVRCERRVLHTSNGLWLPRHRAVVLDVNLRTELVRPTLAHECSHAEYDDVSGHHPKDESRANLHSALRLVNPALWDELATVIADYDAICLELGITRRQFRAYYEHKRRTDASQARLQGVGSSSGAALKSGVSQWSRKYEVA